MRKLLAVTAIAFILALSAVLPAQAGKIVLTNDEWTLSDSGFGVPNDPGRFALNVANWFTGSTTGNSFLVYTSNFGLTGGSLSSVMTGAGNTWTVTTGVPQNLATLQSYAAVFLAGTVFDNNELIQYVNGGGNVFLEGGTGLGGAAAEAAQWNTFLNAFGLGFGSVYNGVGGDIPINSSHPIFAGVDHLYQNNGNDTLDINASDPSAQVLVTSGVHGLYAVYESVSVPEPGTLLLLGAALLGLFGLRRKVSA
jgi:hypothetical protein